VRTADTAARKDMRELPPASARRDFTVRLVRRLYIGKSRQCHARDGPNLTNRNFHAAPQSAFNQALSPLSQFGKDVADFAVPDIQARPTIVRLARGVKSAWPERYRGKMGVRQPA